MVLASWYAWSVAIDVSALFEPHDTFNKADTAAAGVDAWFVEIECDLDEPRIAL